MTIILTDQGQEWPVIPKIDQSFLKLTSYCFRERLQAKLPITSAYYRCK